MSMVSQSVPQTMPHQKQPMQQMIVQQDRSGTQPAVRTPAVMMAPQTAMVPQVIAMMPQGMIQQGMAMMPQPMPHQSQGAQPQQMMMVMMQMPSGTAAGTYAPIATAASIPSTVVMAAPQVMVVPQVTSASQSVAAPTLPLSSAGRSNHIVFEALHLEHAIGVAPSERVAPPSQSEKPWLRQVTLDSGNTCIQWNVDARRFGGNNTKAVSSEFTIEMPRQGPQPFKMMIVPIEKSSKGGGSRHSKASQAWGRIELKCLGDLQSGIGNLVFSLGVGSGTQTQALRGPVSNDFSLQTSGGLPSGMDEWDLIAAMDPTARTVLVRLEVRSTSS